MYRKMSQHDFEKRLKKLVDREVNICQKEAKIANTIYKHNNNQKKLQTQVFQQSEQLQIYQDEVQTLKSRNANLCNFIAEEVQRIQQNQQRIDDTTKENHMETQRLIEKRQSLLTGMNELGCLKNLTKIFINSRQMPETICGVVIREKGATSHLVPFKIDSLKGTHQDALGKLQEIVGPSDGIDWNDLIMGFARKPATEE